MYAFGSKKSASSKGPKCENLSVHVPALREDKQMVIENIEKIKNVLNPKEVILIVGSDEISKYADLKDVKVIGGAENGKARALNEALRYTTADCVVVFDADSHPLEGFEPRCLEYSASLWNGYYSVPNKWSKSLKVVTDIASLTLLKGRKALGLKVLAPGSGVCVKSEILEKVKWPEEITEDLALGVELSKLGVTADLNEGKVAVEVPSSYFDLKRQQNRWNYGAIRSLKRLRVKDWKDIELAFYLTQYAQTWLPLLALVASPLGLSPLSLFVYYFSVLAQSLLVKEACEANGVDHDVRSLSRASAAGLAMSISLIMSSLRALLNQPFKWEVTPKGGRVGKGRLREEYLLLLTPLFSFLNPFSLPLALQYFASALFIIKDSKEFS